MKVAFLLPSLANKGPVIVACDLVNELVKKSDVKCTVYYFDDIVELKFNCECIRITAPLKMDFSGYDIVHTHMLRPDIYTSLVRKRFNETRIVSTIHSYMNKDMKNSFGSLTAFFIERIWCFLLNRFDRVVCLSRDMQTYYSRRIKPKRLAYVYNGRNIGEPDRKGARIPEEDLTKIRHLKNKYKIIGGVGNVSKIKGFEQLVQLLSINLNYSLIIIGDGVEREALIALSEKIGVSERCLFLGYRANAADYFSYFDVYAVTSFSEGFPLVLLEAASHGLPTVCSDLPIFKEVFDSSEVGFYRLYDILDLSQTIDKVMENSTSYSVRIRRKFEMNYTAEKMCNKYLDIYNDLLSQRN
jgi:glycosyltransferase involved in cell wall biosynthesis